MNGRQRKSILHPGLAQLVICGLCCFWALIIGLNLDASKDWVMLVIVLICYSTALVFGVTWIYAMVMYFLWSWAEVRAMFSESEYAGERDLTRLQNEQMIILERLSDDRLKLVGKLRAAIMVNATTKELDFTFTIGDKVFKYEYVDRFMAMCDRVALCAEGTFNDDSTMRDVAETLTHMFILEGYAAPGRGNRAARWINYEDACERVGWSPARKYAKMLGRSERGETLAQVP